MALDACIQGYFNLRIAKVELIGLLLLLLW